MSKRAWADVKRRDLVELKGKPWTVVAIEHGKKKVAVTVELDGRRASTKVPASDRVKIVGRAEKKKRTPLHDDEGTQKRWASKKEHAKVLGLEPGDPSAVKPPAKATGGLWDTPAGKIERKLDEILGARLVGETKDAAVGYYVPPVNVTSVAGHMAVFHGGIPEACDDEAKMLAAHAVQHEAARKGEAILAVNHWHTEKRP